MRAKVMLDVESSGNENISVKGYKAGSGGKKSIQINIGQYGFMLDGLFWKAFKKGAHNQVEKGGPIWVAVKLDRLDDPEIAKPSLHVAVMLEGSAPQPLNGDISTSFQLGDGRTLRAVMTPETADVVNRMGIEEFLTPEITAEILKENKTVKLVWLTKKMCRAVARRVSDVFSDLMSYGIPEVEDDEDDPETDDIEGQKG